jgi:hypothetical protein
MPSPRGRQEPTVQVPKSRIARRSRTLRLVAVGLTAFALSLAGGAMGMQIAQADRASAPLAPRVAVRVAPRAIDVAEPSAVVLLVETPAPHRRTSARRR